MLWDKADHIGDGVYVIPDGYGVWLHANDLRNPTDRIFLEPVVYESLRRYMERLAKEDNP